MAFNKSHFRDLRAVLTAYRNDVDALVKENYVDPAWENIYSKAYLDELKAAKISQSKTKMDSMRVAAAEKVDRIIKRLHEDVSNWVGADTDSNMLNRLQSIKVMGTKLSYSDIQLLAEKAAGQYLPLKMLSEIAADNHIVLNAPSSENYTKQISSVQSGCNALLNMYCGPNAELLGMLPNNTYMNIDYGPFKAWQCISADYILRSDSVLNEAENQWEDSMPSITKKEFLTDAESEQLSGFYKGHESDTANRTKELININPALRNLIELSEYAKFLPPEE